MILWLLKQMILASKLFSMNCCYLSLTFWSRNVLTLTHTAGNICSSSLKRAMNFLHCTGSAGFTPSLYVDKMTCIEARYNAECINIPQLNKRIISYLFNRPRNELWLIGKRKLLRTDFRSSYETIPLSVISNAWSAFSTTR